MRKIEAIKIGNVVNLSIDGKLHRKPCSNAKEADELYRTALKAKADPSDANIKAIRLLLNERTRIAMEAGLEACPETGEVFLAGFSTPIPDDLVAVIKDYNENGYPIDAVINFWKLLMVNPDKRVRTDLFKFIQTHDFVLTDTGYMLVYKAVKYKEKEVNDVAEFVTNQFLHVKQDWKCSPNKYVVYRNAEGMLGITKKATAENWDKNDKAIEFLGNLGDLNTELEKLGQASQTVYTDKHTGKMNIKLGQPVKMERTKCDADPKIDCSYGLHVGATKYVERFADNGNAVLVCLVNPANVVAVPEYDHSKMRVSEYFPIAVATYTDKKISIVEQKYFESDYRTYEQEELQAMIEKVQANEPPIPKAMNIVEDETRPMSELQKILEARVIVLNK